MEHAQVSLQRPPTGCVVTATSLARFTTEASLTAAVDEFVGSASDEHKCNDGSAQGSLRLLFIQCDPSSQPVALIQHAMYIAQRRALSGPSATVGRHVVFLVHLPPGTRRKPRAMPLDFSPCASLRLDRSCPSSLLVVDLCLLTRAASISCTRATEIIMLNVLITIVGDGYNVRDVERSRFLRLLCVL